MALYSWLSAPSSDSLSDYFSPVLSNLGLQVCEEACTEQQLYAVEVPVKGGLQYSKRVNVTATWSGSSKKQCQVEVRSSGPMFKSDTRCQKVAQALRIYAPPIL